MVLCVEIVNLLCLLSEDFLRNECWLASFNRVRDWCFATFSTSHVLHTQPHSDSYHSYSLPVFIPIHSPVFIPQCLYLFIFQYSFSSVQFYSFPVSNPIHSQCSILFIPSVHSYSPFTHQREFTSRHPALFKPPPAPDLHPSYIHPHPHSTPTSFHISTINHHHPSYSSSAINHHTLASQQALHTAHTCYCILAPCNSLISVSISTCFIPLGCL